MLRNHQSYVDVLLSSLWRSFSLLLSRLFIILVSCRRQPGTRSLPEPGVARGPTSAHVTTSTGLHEPLLPYHTLEHGTVTLFYCYFFFVLSLKPLHYYNLSQNHFCYTAITIYSFVNRDKECFGDYCCSEKPTVHL